MALPKFLRHRDGVFAALGALIVWSADAAPPTVDPCALVANADIEQILGKLGSNPKGDSEGDARWCTYEFANGTDAMEIWVLPSDALARAREKAKSTLPAAGLGDEAFMVRKLNGIDYLDLFVRKGDVTMNIALLEMPGDEQKLIALARKAIERL